MKLPLQIQFHGLESSAALEAHAHDHVRKLEQFAQDITACRVTVEVEQKHQHQGRPFSVHIDLTLPGHELVVNRVQHEDAYIALRDAFDKLRRQLEDAVRRRRGEEKHHAQTLHGEVVRVNVGEGFGFIRAGDGEEFYFNQDNVAGTPFRHVAVGAAVQFIPEDGPRGPQAKRVSLGKHGAG